MPVRFLENRPLITAAALLVAGLFVRVPFMWMEGYSPDLLQYAQWSWKSTALGVHTLYDAREGITSDNHPLQLYPVRAVGEVYKAFSGGEFPITAVYDPALRFLLRVPAVLADLLIGVLLFGRFFTRGRSEPGPAFAAAAAFIFNPAVIFDSALYGQIDSVHGLFCLAAALSLERGRFAWAGAALGLAFAQKPQAYVLFPLFAIAMLRRGGAGALGRALAAAFAAAAAACVPFILSGTFGELAGYFLDCLEVHPSVSWNGTNFWWLLFGENAIRTPDTAPAWGLFLSYRALGLGLMFAALAFVWRAAARGADLFISAALSVFAFYFFATQMKENYLYLALPFLAAAWPGNPRAARLFAATSVLFCANMALFYPAWVGTGALFWPRWLLSAAHAALFAWAFAKLHDSVTIGRTPGSEAKSTNGPSPA